MSPRELYRHYARILTQVCMGDFEPECDQCGQSLPRLQADAYNYGAECRRVYCSPECWHESEDDDAHATCIECAVCGSATAERYRVRSDSLVCAGCAQDAGSHENDYVSRARLDEIRVAARGRARIALGRNAELHTYKRMLRAVHDEDVTVCDGCFDAYPKGVFDRTQGIVRCAEMGIMHPYCSRGCYQERYANNCHDFSQRCYVCGESSGHGMKRATFSAEGNCRVYCVGCVPANVKTEAYSSARVRAALTEVAPLRELDGADYAVYEALSRTHGRPILHRRATPAPLPCVNCGQGVLREKATVTHCDALYCDRRCLGYDRQRHLRCAHCETCGAYEPELRLCLLRKPNSELDDENPRKLLVCSKCRPPEADVSSYRTLDADRLAACVAALDDAVPDVYAAAIMSLGDGLPKLAARYAVKLCQARAVPAPAAASDPKKRTATESKQEAPTAKAARFECPVCYGPLNGFTIPCGHPLCTECAPKVLGKPCPTCRNPFTMVLRVYFDFGQ